MRYWKLLSWSTCALVYVPYTGYTCIDLAKLLIMVGRKAQTPTICIPLPSSDKSQDPCIISHNECLGYGVRRTDGGVVETSDHSVGIDLDGLKSTAIKIQRKESTMVGGKTTLEVERFLTLQHGYDRGTSSTSNQKIPDPDIQVPPPPRGNISECAMFWFQIAAVLRMVIVLLQV
ncbi:hypothetical protein Cgig2_011395 [Carnegiea gigantea]|uniref:Uncharacterized protein n=1 Tax=Carnegiea gigantea TaxID=171969 RepID=A0A9Q1KS91_9CARY|nr:hypothetical protein Cgig2_011395 [Carnegiea gigantea]